MTKSQFMKVVKATADAVYNQKPRRMEQFVALAIQHAGARGIYHMKPGTEASEDPVVQLVCRIAGARMDFAMIRHDPNPDMTWNSVQLLEEAWEAFQVMNKTEEQSGAQTMAISADMMRPSTRSSSGSGNMTVARITSATSSPIIRPVQ